MQDEGGRTSSRSLWALAATLLVIGSMLWGGLASAQSPLPLPLPTITPIYELPTPTPTPSPTPSGTPFQDPPAQPAPTGPLVMKPFPLVRTAGTYSRNRTRFTKVIVIAQRGALVAGRCSKRSRKCRTQTTIGRRGRLRLHRLQRSFKPKTKITIRVTAPSQIGKYVEIRTRRAKPPLRHDRCLAPGSTRPSACPDA